MTEFEYFKTIITGKFNNDRQIEREEQEGVINHPRARHENAICNNKIKNLPSDFSGIFVLEESYYTNLATQKQTVLPHLFLFTENEEHHVTLTSYEVPKDIPVTKFTNANPDLLLDYTTLVPSTKFHPLTYAYSPENGFYGKSLSTLAPELTLYLEETLKENVFEVTEIMKRGDKVLIGFDGPIIYDREKKETN